MKSGAIIWERNQGMGGDGEASKMSLDPLQIFVEDTDTMPETSLGVPGCHWSSPSRKVAQFAELR